MTEREQVEYADFELYEVQRGYPDMMVVSASGPREQAWREILHYAAVYGQDGPVMIREVTPAHMESDNALET